MGALIPVVIPIPARIGFLFVALASAFAAVSYWLGRDPAPTANVPKERVNNVIGRFGRNRGGVDDDSEDPPSSGESNEPDPPARPAESASDDRRVPVPTPPRVPESDPTAAGSAEPTREYTFPPFDPPTEPPTR